MKRVAILGGSFDPPTVSHMQIAAETLYQHKCDQVWIVPCGDRLDKQTRTPGPIRLELTKLAMRDFFPEGFPVMVKDIEIENKTTIPTYFLMKRFEELYPPTEFEFHFIMGSDLIPTLHLWHEPERLVSEISFILYNRLNGDDSVNLEKCMPLGMPQKYSYLKGSRNLFGEISSTEVRRRIAESRERGEPVERAFNIAGLVPKAVI